MASADISQDLICSICLNLYTDPVTLRCGHNFCRDCINGVPDTKDGLGLFACPECRATFRKWPPLQRNIALCNVVENFMSTRTQQEAITGICCTYCIHSPVPAVKSCLLCEVSVCDNHLKVHIKTAAEHVLTDPSTSLKSRKCSIHRKILEYYCTEDAACICVSCTLAGEHRGHKVEMLDEASEKKKKKLRNSLQKLITKGKETKERVQSLEECKTKAQEKAAGEAEKVTALFIDIRERLDNLEKKVLSEVSRRKEKVLLSLSNVIHQLEIKKDELSKKIRHIEELCNMTDPLTVLQEPDTSDLCDPEEEGGDEDTRRHDGGDEDLGGNKTHDIDVDVFCGLLRAGLSDILTDPQNILPRKPKEMRSQPPRDQSLSSHKQNLLLSDIKYESNDVIASTVCAAGTEEIYDPADILLDVNTAANNLLISDDLKTVTWTWRTQNHPETAERFQDYDQVMSREGFTSGRHYWDVEISRSKSWSLGMCYPSLDRSGRQSFIGYNDKSWGLYRGLGNDYQYTVKHDSEVLYFSDPISSDRFRIFLDYEAGQLSFYALCDPITHLHTYTASFSEPLHAVLWACESSIKIS